MNEFVRLVCGIESEAEVKEKLIFFSEDKKKILSCYGYEM